MNVNEPTQIDWEELLENIEDGNVIPIIGNELYRMKDGRYGPLIDEFITDALKQEYKTDFPIKASLPEAISALERDKGVNLNKLIRKLKDTVEDLDVELPLLEEFLKIDKLNFFTNTTVYATLLEKKIKQVRKQTATTIDFSIRSKFNDCEELEQLTEPHIFNVFGSFKSADPALKEEEMLEFTTSFKERMTDNANNILDTLKNNTLLFIGCSHPDWLIRFFLRVLSNERVNDWLSRRSKIIVVNDQTNDRQKQYEFFKNYKAITYEGNTAEFVEELINNWKQQNPATVKPKMVFLSYTQKDVTAVENFKQALMKVNNITCWYDKERLHSGDNFEMDIIANIRSADLFIPLISENCLTQQDKYVIEEWSRADFVNKFREIDGKKERYLMPIVIDNADLNNNIIKKYYPQLSIEKVPDGNANDEFLTRLKTVLNLS